VIAMGYRIAIGTVGSGLWVSYNEGGKFRHIPRGIDAEGNCRALAVSPSQPGVLLASQDRVGVFRSEDNGGEWVQVGNTISSDIWSLAFDPNDDQRLFVGTRPGVYRSSDGGNTFDPLTTSIPERCPIGVPRTTNVIVDPEDSASVWASVEVAGLHRSRDGGDTWTSVGRLGPTEFHDDVHGFTMLRRPGGSTRLLASSPYGIATSDDDGVTWLWHEFDAFPGSRMGTAYCRCVRPVGDDGTVIVCDGDYIPGATGALEVSRDGGETWKRTDLPVKPNSTMYWLAAHEALPGVVVATSVFGQIYVSDDNAETWRKLDREFGEIRAVCLFPD
jgi:photosystem II stability/assembly factor-like uncharacterized protein